MQASLRSIVEAELVVIIDRPVVFNMALEMKETASKRDELIEIASKLFYQQGYQATGIKQIIDEAGIAKGTFYSHFKSKEELGLAWLKSRHETWNSWRDQFLGDTELSPRDRLLGMFDFLGKWMIESDFRGCAFLNTMAETPSCDSPLRKEVQQHKEGLRRYIHDLVSSYLPHGSEEQINQKADAIFLLFEAALVESQNFRDSWPIEVGKKQVEGILP